VCTFKKEEEKGTSYSLEDQPALGIGEEEEKE